MPVKQFYDIWMYISLGWWEMETCFPWNKIFKRMNHSGMEDFCFYKPGNDFKKVAAHLWL